MREDGEENYTGKNKMKKKIENKEIGRKGRIKGKER